MSFLQFFGGSKASSTSRAFKRRIRLESLESRRLLATLIVTNLADNDPAEAVIEGSLRWAIESADSLAGSDTITFEPGLSGTVDLQSQLAIGAGNDLEIVGPANMGITLSGGGEQRVLYVNSASVDISRLTIANGFSVDFPDVPAEINGLPVSQPAPGTFSGGGGILIISGNVQLNRVTFINNQTGGVVSAENPFGRTYVGLGGAIGNFFGGNLVVSNSSFNNNAAIGLGIAAGGAIDTDSLSTSLIVGSSFTDNSAVAILGNIAIVDPLDPANFQGTAVGGALKASGASQMTVRRSTFTDNAVVGGNGIPDLGPNGGMAGGGAVGSQALSLFVGVVAGESTKTLIEDSQLLRNNALAGDAAPGGFLGGTALGGAIVNWGASEMLVRRTSMIGNSAIGGAGGPGVESSVDGGDGGPARGGAIDTGFSSFGTPVTQLISTVTIKNQALAGNGGAAAAGGTPGDGGDAWGGAISNSSDRLVELLGGGLLATGNVSVRLGLVSNNRAIGGAGAAGGDGLGGGVQNQATMSLRFTPIAGNVAQSGTGTTEEGEGIGGGLYSAAIGTVDLDFLTELLLRRNRASTSSDNFFNGSGAQFRKT